MTFRSPWKRVVMIAMAFPLAVLANLARMLCIVVAAWAGGANGQAWGNYVHDGGPFGIISLLPYVIAFLGLFIASYFLEKGLRPVLAGIVAAIRVWRGRDLNRKGQLQP